MLVSKNQVLKDMVLDNLMAAHTRLSHSGNAIHLIIVTRFILRLLQKRPDELIEIVSEQDEKGRRQPVD